MLYNTHLMRGKDRLVNAGLAATLALYACAQPRTTGGDRNIVISSFGNISIVNPDTLEALQIAGRCKFLQPTVSRSGRILVPTDCGDGNTDLYIYGNDGTDPIRLTTTKFNERQPRFNPKNPYIVFVSDENRLQIYTMRNDGEELRQLTDNDADNWSPDFSPDGKSIAFVSNILGYPEIFTMTREGEDVRQVTTSGGKLVRSYQSILNLRYHPGGNSVSFVGIVEGSTMIYMIDLQNGNESPLVEGANINWRDEDNYLYTRRPRLDTNSSDSKVSNLKLYINSLSEREEFYVLDLPPDVNFIDILGK